MVYGCGRTKPTQRKHYRDKCRQGAVERNGKGTRASHAHELKVRRMDTLCLMGSTLTPDQLDKALRTGVLPK